MRQLGTYGFIKDATGFLVGATGDGEKKLGDFGWQMERLVLLATGLGLGTCWLGGTFTKSSFSRKTSARPDELIPAVVSIGYIARKPRRIDLPICRGTQDDQRIGRERLFITERFGAALTRQAASKYAIFWKMSGWRLPLQTNNPGGSSARMGAGIFICGAHRATGRGC